MERFLKEFKIGYGLMKEAAFVTIDVPVKSSMKDSFTGSSAKLSVVEGQVTLPTGIVDIIESIQKGLLEGERGLIYINDFREEYRCFPNNEILSDLAKRYEPFALFLTYVPQKVKLDGGRINLPKRYHSCKNVLLVPSGHYFALRDIDSNH